MTTESTERKYPVPPSEIGKPLLEQEQYDLLRERMNNIVALDWFTEYIGVRKVFENLRTNKKLVRAEILEKIEEPDASVITLEFRWPVKTDIIITQELNFMNNVKKAKSYPATYNSIIVTLDRVQNNPPTLDFEHVVTIEGGKIELIHWCTGSLRPIDVEDAINKAFLNPKTKGLQEGNS